MTEKTPTSTALMIRPCTALVATRRRVRRLRRRYTATRINGHHFKSELDWHCESCGARLDPRAFVYGTPPEGSIEPCPLPTLSRAELLFASLLAGLLWQSPEPEA